MAYPTGITYTFMAAEALRKAAESLGMLFAVTICQRIATAAGALG